jgi:hypothetical protein
VPYRVVRTNRSAHRVRLNRSELADYPPIDHQYAHWLTEGTIIVDSDPEGRAGFLPRSWTRNEGQRGELMASRFPLQIPSH